MGDEQVMHAVGIDDAYHVERVFARRADGVTELVTLDGAGPFVRRRIPLKLVRRAVWATLAECHCRRLPRVEATYEMPDEFVVVTDYVPGDTLEQIVESQGRLSEEDAARIVAQICEAAAELHAHNVVHRDISPTNVIVAADGAHLIDLGIARLVVDGAPRDTTQLGTWGFASPEQYGFAQTDARSDVYSIGRVLGYLLTGERPDADGYAQALEDAQIVSSRLRAVVERACAFEPSARYQTVDELARALDLGVVGEKGVGSPVSGEGAHGPVAGSASGAAGERASVGAFTWEPAPESSPGLVKRLHTRGTLVVVLVLVVALIAAAAFALAGGFGGGEAPTASEPAVSSGADSSAASESTSDDESESTAVPSTTTVSADPETPALEITETAWSVDSDGYVRCVAALYNPDSVYSVRFPEVNVVGRDASGATLFSSSLLYAVVQPGETVYESTLAGKVANVASVEFELVDSDPYNVLAVNGVTSFEVSDLHVVEGSTSTTAFLGTVTTTSVGDESFGNEVLLTLVVRDADGKLCGSFMSKGIARPALGESATFEIDAYGLPDYATYEVHADATY